MAIDFKHYEGREPAFVKHTFLDKYLPALMGKIASSFDEFVYVDGFAGPWKSASGETFEDTSFGIALYHMTALRLSYLARGRDIRMRAFLVEKDATAFRQLSEVPSSFPKIEVVPLRGQFEDHAPAISRGIGSGAFMFALIDPKGFPAIERILPLLSRDNCEALVNFMYDHANRFAETGLIPTLERWLANPAGGDFRQEIEGLSGAEREKAIEFLAVEKLRKAANYEFATTISVDKTSQDRTLYKLIYLTRHSKGIEVFRTSEAKALEAQASARSEAKSRRRSANSGMDDMFAGSGLDAQADRSARKQAEGLLEAEQAFLNMLAEASGTGLLWRDIWPKVLEQTVVTKSSLGNIANNLRKSGRVSAPNWPSERHRQPKEHQVLVLGNHP